MLEGQDAYTSGKIGGDDDDLFGSDSESSSDSESDEEEVLQQFSVHTDHTLHTTLCLICSSGLVKAHQYYYHHQAHACSTLDTTRMHAHPQDNKPDALIDSGKQIRMLRGDKASFAQNASSSSSSRSSSGGGSGVVEAGGSGDGKGKSKRKRGDMEGSNDVAGTGADGEQAGDDHKRSRSDSPSAQSVGSDGGVAQLTDANVAAFVQAQPGGRTTFVNMGKHFKKHMKALNKKIKGSGDVRFLGIVNRILTKFEDPALGPVFKLK
jgi:hypothetical protein